ncbi:pyrroline-5-carboxylate reductase [Elusimicrobium posterum]|uniref:pyrroline-5-carboxylate reductase family protein n=1 Tax=Elusimicrobium posterum TaxID=3116653 RepID=UPI003C77FA96
MPHSFKADFVVYCVKPYILEEALKQTKHLLKKNTLILSIAAGKSIKEIKKVLGAGAAVVRAMPNLPMSVGEGVAGLYAEKNVTAKQRKICEEVFKNSGISFWVKAEKDITKVTAVSGSSPAYIYAMVDALETVCADYGFDKKTSADIAAKILTGCAKLLKESKLTPKELNKNIATPGGTTEAALKVLGKNKALYKLTKKAADAAKDRFK